jgi:hypothetical protein
LAVSGWSGSRTLSGTADTATLQDCQDDTAYRRMNTATGQRLTHGTARVHLTATLDLGADGAW